ncbi:MAG: fructose-6-phosphate aldolase [Clostridia bacterium]|nr:fructose-6-phosphate aldolase [Clostridia bacterium]
MKYFIDSANVDKIKGIFERFPCDGVTTNPTILARESDDPAKTLLDIRGIIGDRTLFVQVTAEDGREMVSQAKTLCGKIGGALSIKIPATEAGVYAMKELKESGVPVTATAVYTVQQALLCAKAGAGYIAPYVAHIDDYGIDSAETVENMARLLRLHAPEAVILAASFRVAEQINRVIAAGACAVTVTPETFEKLIVSDGTKRETDAFRTNWKNRFGDSEITDFFK